jgi:uncharacterized repeat protein (TIGR03806 family)
MRLSSPSGYSIGFLTLCILGMGCGSSGSPDQGASGSAGASANGDAGASSGASSMAGGGVMAGNAGGSGASGGGDAAGNSGAGGSGGTGNPIPGTCAPPVDLDAPYARLSQTGCMDTSDPTKFGGLVIPYEVNSPLWSDGADKLRGMVLPAGKTIHIKDCAKEPALCTQGPADTGQWVFPVGTVMLKSFLFDDKLVETRLFVHHDDQTWVGYTYQWDEAQTDATLVPDERTAILFDTQQRTVSWNYPSRTDCMQCHNPAGGSTLGPDTRQMNRMVGGANQIDTLASKGVFDAIPTKPYLDPLVTPYAGQLGGPAAGSTAEQKARSYLAANCAFCHRPDGDFSALDLRFDTALKDTNGCNAAPLKGDNGVPTATILTPGDPTQSLLWVRMSSLPGAGRMPQIASYVVDQDGVKVVGDWITSIKTGTGALDCPAAQ